MTFSSEADDPCYCFSGGEWLSGKSEVTEKEGDFPTGYVEAVTEELCVALLPHEAPSAEYLAFSPGDQIRVVAQEGEWWYGLFNKQVGFFPGQYVKSIASLGSKTWG